MRTGRPIEVDLILLLQPQLPQTAAQLQGELFVLDKAHVGVARQLEIGPLLIDFLLDTVDNLLDFLNFFVHSNQAS